MNASRFLLPLLAVAVVVSACAADDASETESATSASPATSATENRAVSPWSPDETLLGVSWFSPAEPSAADAVHQRWDDIQQSVGVARSMIDWIDVEPERGEYQLAPLLEGVESLPDGAAKVAGIVAVDVSGTPFPDWLGEVDSDDAASAYVDMVTVALPALRDAGVVQLAIANEPPLFEPDFDLAAFVEFVEGVTVRLDEVAPDLQATFTFAGTDALHDDPFVARLIDAVDIVSVNHYCLTDEFLVIDDLADMPARVDAYGAAAGDKQVIFQEFGCPASAANGSSEAFQAAWFAAALDHIADDPQIAAAFVFEFHDWSPDLVADLYGAIRAEPNGEVVFDRLAGWLESSGFTRRDGTTRPAWDVFVEAVENTSAATS